ncbi:MAG: Com family DNA-binding transcriptional regulator [Parcubacteria group bacterium]|nr:Com family DNA-binding transcriptional regulator [Parcubacteria group bacterium]
MFIENFSFLQDGLIMLPGLAAGIDNKYLREYRCPSCHKLLAKGQLNHRDDILEVKCRGCSTICLFKGEDAEIIEKRSGLLRQGLIPDPDKV